MLSVKSIMITDVISVKPDTPLYEALTLLTKHKISGMPVVDEEQRVVGLLSEKDVLRILVDRKLEIKSTVADYMSKAVISFSEDASAFDICQFFIRSHVRRVPIVKDCKLVGIVSRGDLIPLILEAKTKISNFRYV